MAMVFREAVKKIECENFLLEYLFNRSRTDYPKKTSTT